MPKLNNQRAETFCNIMAKEDCDPAEACFRAGYGSTSHKTSYHNLQASRLMEKKDIIFRIKEIRDALGVAEKTKQESMIEFLYRATFYDPTKFVEPYITTLENGNVAQTIVYKKGCRDFTKWDIKDRQMIDHFDSKTGIPVFVSKTWAAEKLLKILQLDGSKSAVDVEDILSLFNSAGLRLGDAKDIKPDEEYETNVDFSETDEDDLSDLE